MGRRRSQLGTDADREEVGRLLRQEQPGWLKERLIALRMGFSPENSMAFIAQCIGRSPATVRRVFEAFRKGGIGLVSSRQFKGGTHTLLEDGVREFLLEGLREGRWNTAVQAREQLLERFGREYSYKTVWYWLKKCAGVIRVPRPAHEQRDLGRGEAFKEGFGAILEELALDAAKPAKVWFADESRYGLLPCLRRCWTLKGLRQTKPWRTRYQWSYCYGALDVVDGESVFIQTPTVNLQWTELFLLEIKKMYPNHEHVVVWDGAGFHPLESSHPRIPSGVHVVRLPPYSPELNPIEKLWDCVQDYTSNRLWPSIERLDQAVADQLEGWWTDPRRVLRLVGDNWQHRLANDSAKPILVKSD